MKWGVVLIRKTQIPLPVMLSNAYRSANVNLIKSFGGLPIDTTIVK